MEDSKAMSTTTTLDEDEEVENVDQNEYWSMIDTAWKTHFGNGYRLPLVTSKAPVTDQVLQISQER
jgi:hypothetical protein